MDFCPYVSLQLSSLPLRAAQECQKKVVTHTHMHTDVHTSCRSGRAVTAHSGGMLGDSPHWDIAVCVCVRVLETEGGVFLSRRVSQISHLALSFPSYSSICILPLFNYLFLSSSFHLVLTSFLFTFKFSCSCFPFFHVFVLTIFLSLLL